MDSVQVNTLKRRVTPSSNNIKFTYLLSMYSPQSARPTNLHFDTFDTESPVKYPPENGTRKKRKKERDFTATGK
jgi:hypothetical protein